VLRSTPHANNNFLSTLGMTQSFDEWAELEKRKNMDDIYLQFKEQLVGDLKKDPSITGDSPMAYFDNVEISTAKKLQEMNLSLEEKLDLMERLFERDVALRVSEKFGNKSMNADIDVKKDLAKLELEQFPLRLVGAPKILDKNLGTNEAELMNSRLIEVEK
jgi:uncharacterized Zn finger protein